MKPLTFREREYVTLAVSDLSFEQIAAILNVEERTVRSTLSLIYSKLEVKNRYGLIIQQLKQHPIVEASEQTHSLTEDPPLPPLDDQSLPSGSQS
jgi:DNA-binding CsgD family transcriptional regulator